MGSPLASCSPEHTYRAKESRDKLVKTWDGRTDEEQVKASQVMIEIVQ